MADGGDRCAGCIEKIGFRIGNVRVTEVGVIQNVEKLGLESQQEDERLSTNMLSRSRR
jgi:hypothetical protein